MEYKEIIKDSYYHDNTGMLLKGDCLEIMKDFPDKSVDMILCDLPYGTTACKWDTIIPFEPLWEQYERIIKDNGVIILTGSQPFTSALIMSNPEMFKYELIWVKERPTNFLMGKKQIMKYHENILIFYYKQPTYNALLEKKLEKNKRKNKPRNMTNQVYGIKEGTKYGERTVIGGNKDWIYPKSIQFFSMQRGLHPTQKPVALFEYLIKTYTDENEIVLDNCAGSCTTAIACKNTGRRWICIEQEEKYCGVSVERIKNHIK